MKRCLAILALFVYAAAPAQTDQQKLEQTIRNFHQALVAGNTVSINQQTDKALSYGHSNGWLETKTELMKNLETGVMKYRTFSEDSLSITMNGTMANARFVADIKASFHGKDADLHLKVLEVWVRKSNRWVLFARQAVK